MRDLQRLEELSSAAALGLWADDVVLALDRATSGFALAETDATLLSDAAEMLEAALQRTEHPLATPKSARGLAATNTALTLVASNSVLASRRDSRAWTATPSMSISS